MKFYAFILSLLVVTGAQQSDSRENTTGDDELNEDQTEILNGLGVESLLERVDAENGGLDILQIEEVLRLVSAGNNMDKPIEEALEGTLADFLLLTPDVLADEFGDGTLLTRRQFSEALPTILSCLTIRECALSTDAEFIEDEHGDDDHEHEDEQDGDSHDNEDEQGEHEEDRDNDGSEHEDDEHEHEDDEHEHEDDEHKHEESEHNDSEHEDEHDSHEHDEHEHGEHEHEEHEEDDEDEDYVFNIKMIALSVLFVEALLGAMVPITLGTFNGFKQVLSFLNCFAGGVLLATGFIHLIPHVIEYEAEIDELGDYPLGLVLVVVGFAVVFYIEHVLVDVHSHSDKLGRSCSHNNITVNVSLSDKDGVLDKTAESSRNANKIRTWWMELGELKECLILLVATSAHSILEALVVGIEDDDYTVWILFASIAGHKGVTAMAISARFYKCNATTKEALFVSILFALTAPISILIGISLDDVPAWTNLILTALSTGTFIYIGAYEVISEEFCNRADPDEKADEQEGYLSAWFWRHIKFLAISGGVVMISLVALIPHAHHGDHDHNH